MAWFYHHCNAEGNSVHHSLNICHILNNVLTHFYSKFETIFEKTNYFHQRYDKSHNDSTNPFVL